VAIPLPSGGYGYGRVLDKLVAFYNLKTSDVADINDVSRQTVIFTASVHISALSGGRWPAIGSRPLELEFHNPTKFFRKNPSGPGFLIYVSKPTPRNAYEEYKANAGDCIGLEPLLVWDPDQISERLEDHFLGRKNRYLSHYIGQLVS
jgi:hypothetical protein